MKINKNIAFLLGAMTLSGTALGQEVVKSTRAGSGVYEAVFSTQDGHLYVTAAGSRTNPAGALFKVNPESMTVVDSILLKENPPYGIGINNKTQTVYTTNTRTNTVSAVDLKTGKLLATIKNGAEKSHTREVLVDETNNLIYITDVGSPSNIWVIDGNTNSYSHAIENVGESATGITFLNNTDKLYLTIMNENAVYVVDTKTRKVEKSFPAGGESPINIVSDGKRLFVTNQKSGTLTVLTAEGELIKSIPTGAGAIGIAYDPIKKRVYSANRQSGTTTVIDAETLEVLADLPTGSYPNHVKIHPQTGEAFVINKAKAAVQVEGKAPELDKNGDIVTKIK